MVLGFPPTRPDTNRTVQLQKIVRDMKFWEYIPFFFFLILFNVPFKIISLIETSQSIGGAKQEYPRKTT